MSAEKKLPAGWEVKRLGDVCELITKGTTPTSIGHKFSNKGVSFIKVESLSLDGQIIPDKVAYISLDCHEDLRRSQLQENDLLFSIAGALGRVGLVNKTILPANTNQALAIIRLKKDMPIDHIFLMHCLRSSIISSQIEIFRGGVAQQNLSLGQLNEMLFPLPPLFEQKRIVAILDEAFQATDRAKENAEKNLANAREVFDGYLTQVFSNPGKDWEETILGDVCDDITVGHVGTMASKYKKNGIPFLRSQNVKPHFISLEDVVFIDEDFNKQLKKSQLHPGDLAIVRTGYPGTAAVIPESLKNANCSDLVIARPSKGIDPFFLCFFFNSLFGKRLVLGNIVGAAQKHFNISAAKNVMIPVPSYKEQQAITELLEHFSTETRHLESIYKQKLAALDELKKSILQKAFSGEL